MAIRRTKPGAAPRAKILDTALRHATDSVAEGLGILRGERGDALDRAITFRDVGVTPDAQGLNVFRGLFAQAPALIGGTAPRPVQALTDLVATGTLAGVALTWGGTAQAYYSFTEVWRSATDNLSVAVRLGTSIVPYYVDYVGSGTSYYYWVRAVSTSGALGPYNAVEGTLGQASESPAYILGLLTGEITSSQLATALSERIDLIDAPITGLVDITAAIESAQATLQQNLTDAVAALEAADTAAQAAVDASIATIEGEIDDIITDLTSANTTFTTFRDAVSYVDPGTGNIKLYAVDSLETSVGGQFTAVQVDLDAMDGEIALRATTTALNGVDTRLSSAELTLSSHTGTISALVTDLNAAGDRITDAESELILQAGEISLRATVTEVNQALADLMAGFQPVYAWEFNGTVESWTASGATLTANASTVTLESSGTAPIMQITGLEFDGAEYASIRILLRRVAGSGWAGLLRYATDGHAAYSAASTYAVGDVVIHDNGSGDRIWVCITEIATPESFTVGKWDERTAPHGFSASYQKTLAEPSGDGGYYVVYAAMPQQEAGSPDFSEAVISGIQLLLGNTATDDFEIDRVEVGRHNLEQQLFTGLETRMTQAEIDIDAAEAAIALRVTTATHSALQSQVNTVAADLDAAEAAILLRATTATVNAIDSRLNTAEADINAAEAAILLRATTATVGAIDSRLSTAEADINAAEAAILLRATTATVTAIDSRLSTAEADINAAEAAILLRATTATVTAIDSRLGTAELDINAAEGTISTLVTTVGGHTTTLGTLDTRVGTAEQNIGANTTAIGAEATARLALAARVTDAEEDIAVVDAAVTSESQARVSADAALALDITALSTAIGDVDAAVISESQARASADEGLAEAIGSVSAGVGSNYSAIQTEATARATADALLNAQYTLKLDVNGHIAGIGVAVSGGVSGPISSEMILKADKFAIGFPTRTWAASTAFTEGQYAVPTVGNGRVYRVSVGGTTGATQPSWPTTVGATVVSGTVTFVCQLVSSTYPFVIGTVNGQTAVGINGNLFVDGSITGDKIDAHTITSENILITGAEGLSALNANLGTVTSGLFRTGANPAWRAEMGSVDGFPFWYGQGAKTAANARVSLTTGGVFAVRNSRGEVIFSAGHTSTGGMYEAQNMLPDGRFLNTTSISDRNYWDWTQIPGSLPLVPTGSESAGPAMDLAGATHWLYTKHYIALSGVPHVYVAVRCRRTTSVLVPGEPIQRLSLQLITRNTSGTIVSSTIAYRDLPESTSTWVTLEATFAVPTTAIDGQVRLRGPTQNTVRVSAVHCGVAPFKITQASASTFLEDAVINSAKIGNLQILTDHLDYQTVTLPLAVMFVQSVSISSPVPVLVQSLPATLTGAPVMVTFYAGVKIAPGATGGLNCYGYIQRRSELTGEVEILNAGTVAYSPAAMIEAMPGRKLAAVHGQVGTLVAYDTPPSAGAYVYEVFVGSWSGSLVQNPITYCLEVKR